jgi:hypothetical protein
MANRGDGEMGRWGEKQISRSPCLGGLSFPASSSKEEIRLAKGFVPSFLTHYPLPITHYLLPITHIPITHYPLLTPKLQIPDKLIPRNYEAIAIQTHGMARY